MHIEDAVQSHRAIRGCDSSFSLTREKKDHLLDLVLHAPFAFNLQYVWPAEVSDPQLCTQLHEVAQDQAQVTDAAMLVVVCVQLDSWKRNAQRTRDGTPEAAQTFMAGVINIYYHDKPQVQHDEAVCGCGLSAQTLMLITRSQGLDSCPTDGFSFDAVTRLVSLLDDHATGLMVAVGERAVEPWPRSGKLP